MQLRTSTPQEVLQSLEDAVDLATQLVTLRAIKNYLTGHEIRKIEYIRAGLIPALDQCLADLSSPNSDSEEVRSKYQHEEDAIWSHAASIVGVLANSGTMFTTPILHSNLIRMLLEQLKATQQGRLELMILRALNSIADNLPLDSEKGWVPSTILERLLYTRDNVFRLGSNIGGDAKDRQQQQSMEAVLRLICKTCHSERHKDLLIDTGFLDLLCSEVASFINRHKRSVWDGFTLGFVPHHTLDVANTQSDHISLVLETIALIIDKSESNALSFAGNDELTTAMNAFPRRTYVDNTGHSFDSRLMMDIPLPIVPDSHSINAAKRSPFPPLSASSPSVKRRTSSVQTGRDQNAAIFEDDSMDARDGKDGKDGQGEYLIVPWLLYLVRSSRGKRRLMAAKLLGILKCHGLMQPVRTRSLAALLVPILVDMLSVPRAVEAVHGSISFAELAPSVLALVVRDNEHLQKAAFDARAVPKLVSLLKASFEPSHDLIRELWWPLQPDEKLTDGDPSCSLGRGGPSYQMRNTMQWREGLLQALASIAPDNETYRKEVVDQGALPQIIQALEPFSCATLSEAEVDTISMTGNSPQTIVAACAAVRALTRSATSLRTKLVDAEVSKPIIKLLHTSDPEVRVAATMVMANLAHDFSPMKQSIEPVIRKLCEQAHSANPRLRHESLFALKAMVNNSKNDLKRSVVNELGPNWIKHLIATDPHDVPAGEVIGLVPKDYRKGSMVRLSDDAMMEDADESSASDDEVIEYDEYNSHTLQQDLEIQAELLGFLRNLTTGERPDEIIGYLLEHMGEDDFLQIMIDRLKSGTTQRPMALSPPPAIIFNTLYILTHLCAADRKYRQAIGQNVVMMRQMSALLGHGNASIRCAACWLVTNLVYVNSNESYEMLAQRAKDLQKLGILNQIRRMEKSDPVMDVKERAATASECFSKYLDRT